MKLPRPYKDELLGSVVARGLVYMGLPTTTFVNRFLGRRIGTLSFFLPSGLPHYARALDMSAEQLLWGHTVFPYVTAFMAQTEVERLKAKALEDSTTECSSLSSLVQSSTLGLNALRFCPRCCAREVEEAGESYWHRSHNLPAVHVCSRHGCDLLEVAVTSFDRAFLMPLPHQQGGHRTPQQMPTKVLEDLADRTANLLSSRGCHTNVRRAYRARALDLGYALSSGNVATGQLARDVRLYFGVDVLTQLGCLFSTAAKQAWPARLVQPGLNVAFATVRHVLLQSFLAAASPASAVLDYRTPVRRRREFNAIDQELAKGMRARVAEAQRLKVRLSVDQVMGHTRYWHSFKRHRDRFPATVAALEEYRASDVAWRQRGGRGAVAVKESSASRGRGDTAAR